MARTNTTEVEAKLRARRYAGNYDGGTNLQQFVDDASYIVDDVETCLTGKGLSYSAARLASIECWLACWLYTKTDPMYSSKSTGGAGGSFVGDPTVPEWYKAGALALDSSGCLAAIISTAGARAGSAWLGKRPSEQVAYEDRD